MATNQNKPDLSDLKARLGMKKPPAGAAPGAAPQPGGSPAAFVPPAASQGNAPAAPAAAPGPGSTPVQSQAGFAQGYDVQPAAAAPQAAAPAAPRAMAPPPGARKPPVAAAPRPAARPAPQEPREPLPDLNVSDMGDITPPGSRLFSGPVLIVIVGALALGLLFGYFSAVGSQHRQVYNARTADAKEIRDGLRPRVEKAIEVVTKIEALHPTQVDFEAAEALGDIDFAASGNLLSNNRILLGTELVNLVTNYMADSTMLQTMLAQHKKATADDRKELETLLAENAALVEATTFAVVFDYRDMIRRGGDANYQPKHGSLVTIQSLERDEEGKIEFHYLNSDRTDKSEMQGFIPLAKGDIIKSGGDNALQRYEKRVRDLKIQATILNNYVRGIDSKLSELAERPAASLFTFTSS